MSNSNTPQITNVPENLKAVEQKAPAQLKVKQDNTDPAKDFDVSHWLEQKVTEETVEEYECRALCHPNEKAIPILYLKPANVDLNEKYKDLLTQEGKRLRSELGDPKDEFEIIERMKMATMAIAPRCLIAGWDHMVDRQKKIIPYKERTAIFLWENAWDKYKVKNEIVAFCQKIQNFGKVPDAVITDEEELKNLFAGSNTV